MMKNLLSILIIALFTICFSGVAFSMDVTEAPASSEIQQEHGTIVENSASDDEKNSASDEKNSASDDEKNS